jgi:polyhydroxybutyrate depolymerase
MFQAQAQVSMLTFARLLLASFGLLAAASAVPAAECPKSGSCTLESGRYLAFPPPDWDGKSALPALMFLHGYSQVPEAYAEPAGWFMQFGADHGVLLLIPEGKEKTWSYIGSPMENRDDTGFLADVLDDAAKRYPIDLKRVSLSGFSQGGSMAWYAGCALGNRFRAVLPVAGAFWEPLPANCTEGPLNLLHIHGRGDEVVPMAGRPIGEKWKQGDVHASLAIESTSNQCRAKTDRAIHAIGPMSQCTRTVSSCDNRPGALAYLCMHDGGHWFTRDFMEAGWAFQEAITK